MAFQPFAVQCLTCSSRLRVTDASLLGTISACPKCGSMVEIQSDSESNVPDSLPTAPERVALGTDNVDSETITRDAISAGGMDSDPFPESTQSSAESFSGSDSIPPSQFADSAMPMSPEGWQSDRTRKSRQVGMIVAVSIATLLIAIVVFAWFVRTWSRGDTGTEVAEATQPPELLATEVVPAEVIVPEPPDLPPDSTDVESKQNVSDAPLGSHDEEDAADPKNNVDQEQPTIPEVAMVTSNKEKTSPEIPADLLPIDPLGPIGKPDRDAVAPVADDGRSKLDEIPAELRKFTVLLDLGREANETKPTIATPPTLDKMKVEAAAEETLDPMMIATPPPAIDMNRALALKFALNSKGYPLSDLVLLFSQLSGVPVQMDWMTLDLTETSLRQRVPTPRGFLSAQEHLEQLAESIGANLRLESSYAMLTMDEEGFAKRVESIFDVEDFGDDRASAISVLGKFLQNDAEADPGTVKIGKSLGEQQLAVLAFESLRRMRGLEGKLDDTFLNRWAHPAGSVTGPWPVLTGGDSGPALDAPITIAELLRRVSRKNQATCLVNWFDANRRRLSPEQLVMPYVNDDAGAMLNTALQPFEMQVRRVDEHHLWVGTEATYDRLLLVVWSEPVGDQRDTYMQKVSTAMAGRGEQGFRITHDAVSDRVIMLVPRYIARQLPTIDP
ncbi:hypothetical protein SH528x_001384 [Novipirellula sp. SH528]|uniref:hypothetical protein n=1 Tax=Novipirellula sp. SH528 TaxID=3454466 RepID=UPI003F9FED32